MCILKCSGPTTLCVVRVTTHKVLGYVIAVTSFPGPFSYHAHHIIPYNAHQPFDIIILYNAHQLFDVIILYNAHQLFDIIILYNAHQLFHIILNMHVPVLSILTSMASGSKQPLPSFPKDRPSFHPIFFSIFIPKPLMTGAKSWNIFWAKKEVVP